MAFSCPVRDVLTLKILIKVFYGLWMYSKNLNFVSKSTVYEENNGTIFAATRTRMNLTSKRTAINYNRFKKNFVKVNYVSKY